MNRSNVGANTNIEQMILDAIVLIFSFILSFFIMGNQLDNERLIDFIILIAVFILIFLLVSRGEYLYNVTLFYYMDRILRKVTKAFLTATIATTAILYLFEDTKSGRNFYLSYLLISYILVCIKMIFYRRISQKAHRNKAPRTVFVGKIGNFHKFKYYMEKTSIQIERIGYIAMEKEDAQGNESYLGCLEDLEELIRTYNIDQVYIMQMEGDVLPFTQQYVDLCIAMGVTVRLVVDFYEKRQADSYVSTVGTYPVITYHTISLNAYEQVIKRIIDIIGGLVGVFLFSPIMLIAAIVIKIDSPGSVIFKQTRVGQNGRSFKIYKFRSMYIDAEERKKDLLELNELQGGVMFKIKEDPRITKVGKIIRKLSIDELPQFFNVLQGSMSLVGTRPPTLDEVEKYKSGQWRRISIKPGITGMWQVNGRSNIDNFEEIVEMDLSYIDNWKLSLDIKIICKTILVLIDHKGSY